MLLYPARPVYIHSWGTVVGKKEYEGPLGELFDQYDETDRFQTDTFEKAESEMQKRALGLALAKGGLTAADVDALLAGIYQAFGAAPCDLGVAADRLYSWLWPVCDHAHRL